MNFIAQNKLPSTSLPLIFNQKNVQEIDIFSIESTRQRNCILNSKYYIGSNGGSLQYGWMFSTLGNIAIRFVGHCVVKDSNGRLLCVSPPEHKYLTKLSFIADDSVIEKNGRLKCITFPLVNHLLAIEVAQLENIESDIRSKYKARKCLSDQTNHVVLTDEDSDIMTHINIRKHQMAYELKKLVIKSMKPNDLCYCGTGVKYKKCCS